MNHVPKFLTEAYVEVFERRCKTWRNIETTRGTYVAINTVAHSHLHGQLLGEVAVASYSDYIDIPRYQHFKLKGHVSKNPTLYSKFVSKELDTYAEIADELNEVFRCLSDSRCRRMGAPKVVVIGFDLQGDLDLLEKCCNWKLNRWQGMDIVLDVEWLARGGLVSKTVPGFSIEDIVEGLDVNTEYATPGNAANHCILALASLHIQDAMVLGKLPCANPTCSPAITGSPATNDTSGVRNPASAGSEPSPNTAAWQPPSKKRKPSSGSDQPTSEQDVNIKIQQLEKTVAEFKKKIITVQKAHTCETQQLREAMVAVQVRHERENQQQRDFTAYQGIQQRDFTANQSQLQRDFAAREQNEADEMRRRCFEAMFATQNRLMDLLESRSGRVEH